MAKLFLSHAWKSDELGRNTHKRVASLKKYLKKEGWNVWFDEDDMGLNMDYSMMIGIETSSVFILCVTQKYIDQVDESCSNPYIRKNCYKEFCYANTRGKMIIAVIMEPSLLHGTRWPRGVVSMYIAQQLYIDATGNNMRTVARSITSLLAKRKIFPPTKKYYYIFKRRSNTKPVKTVFYI